MLLSPALNDLLPRQCIFHRSQLAFTCWNWPGQEPLLLLHGMADHGLVWTSLANALGDRFYSVAPDLRGHGDSAKPDSGYSCDEIIADLKALMDHFGWTSAHVVAHSWSAKVATVWATQEPEFFRSLILVDPAFIKQMPNWMRLTFPLFYRILPFLKMMGPFASFDQAAAQAKQLKQFRGWSPLQQLVFEVGIEQKSDGTWGSKFVKAARNGIFEDVLQVAGLTAPIEIPTLFIQPTLGLNYTEAQLQPFRHSFKNLTIQKVPGNHWVFLVEPEAFNQVVADFLNTQIQRESRV